MSPYEHGEVYVLDDGGEADLDLGNYERFLETTLTRDHNITTGKVYQQVSERTTQHKHAHAHAEGAMPYDDTHIHDTAHRGNVALDTRCISRMSTAVCISRMSTAVCSC